MRTVLYLILFLFLFLVSISAIFVFRTPVEEKLVIPLMQTISGRGKGALQIEKTPESVLREIAKLTEENNVLRKQLGALPEKADLIPARVIWDEGTQITIAFSEKPRVKPLQNDIPVVFADTYVGTVVRMGEKVAVVRRPFDSRFTHDARSDRGVQGKLQGTFDQQVRFSFPVGKDVRIGDVISVVEKNDGWQFAVGTVERLDEDKSKPDQNAWIRPEIGVRVPDVVFFAL